MTRPIPDHGSEARYQGSTKRPGCRCRKCIAGWTRAGQKRALLRLEGKPATIPSAQVTAHLRRLYACGMSTGQISANSGVDSSTIYDHAHGSFPKIRRTTAEKLMAVKPHQFGDIGTVPALLSRRRCQALHAAGHSAEAIATATPSLSARTVQYVTDGTRKYVSVINHRSIAAVYQHLSQIRGDNTRAIARAAREGWRDPLWWEDMGHMADPDFDPQAAENGNRLTLAAARRADIEHLASFHVPAHEIAARLGMSADYVHDKIRDMRKAA